MMRKLRIKTICITTPGLILPALLLAGQAFALDYCSTARHGVIAYDTPKDGATRRFVLSAAIPLEILAVQGDWLRVRDRDGSLYWVKKADTQAKRFVQVNHTADVRNQANEQSTLVFKADRNLLLELLVNNRDGWLKVRHRDGQSGFVRIEDVWGV